MICWTKHGLVYIFCNRHLNPWLTNDNSWNHTMKKNKETTLLHRWKLNPTIVSLGSKSLPLCQINTIFQDFSICTLIFLKAFGLDMDPSFGMIKGLWNKLCPMAWTYEYTATQCVPVYPALLIEMSSQVRKITLKIVCVSNAISSFVQLNDLGSKQYIIIKPDIS